MEIRRVIKLEYQLITSPIITEKQLTPIEQIFENRNIKSADINHYLHTTKEDILSPTLLDNMDTGAKMLISHLFNNDKIFIQVDSDVDGFTSAAALINYINMIAPGRAQQNIQYRLHDGKQHGLIIETIPDDVKLVIAPDSSSNDFEQHKILKEKGIDVLVLDHHEADKVSENACVINNQLCNYPNKNLSGVGIVYKFCQYLDNFIEEEERAADLILDLVAVGLTADMMDLRNFETRELISLGINNLENSFLINFVRMQEYSLRGELTPFGISFYIAPYINAVIRVGTLDEKILLFESMLDFRAQEKIPSTKRGCQGQLETRVDQACRICKNVKTRQTKLVDATLAIIMQQIADNCLLDLPIIIVQLDNPVEENLTGLIANKIMSIYMRPVLILNHHIEVDKDTGEVLSNKWMGSGRNATYSKLGDFRGFLEHSQMVEFAQGHPSAFGVCVLDSQISALKDYIQQELKDFNFSNSYRVDFIWQANDTAQFQPDVMKIGELKGYWGQGLTEPYVAIENIPVHKDNLILMSPNKKPTLKITLPGGLTLIKFNSSQEEFDKLYTEEGHIKINVVGTCNLNEWLGNFTPQIIIEEYEIMEKFNYYF